MADVLDDAVLHRLYEAAAGLHPWPDALAGLGAACNGLICQLLMVDRSTGRLVLCEQPTGVVADGVLDYVREYNLIDPHKEYVANHPVGSLLHTADAFPRHTMEEHPFYRDFWNPYGVRSLVATKLAEDERHTAIGSVVRSFDQPPFSNADVELARRYFSHMVVAFRIAAQLRRAHIVANVGMHLMETSGRPMFLLGEGAVLIGRNSAAREYLAGGGLLVERGGCLAGRGAANDKALRKAVDELWAMPPPSACPAVRSARRAAVRLHDWQDGQLALCTVWEMVPETSMGAFGSHRTLLLSVAHPLVGEPPDPVFVGALLDLTPAEARVVSLLCGGYEPAQIATLLRVSLTTIRSHTRAAFAKTGLHRQADLVHAVRRACAA